MTPAWTSQSCEIAGRDERLDAAPPALAQGVREVERGAAAEPVPPRLAGREREREVLGQVVDRSLGPHNRKTSSQLVTSAVAPAG